MHFHAFVAMPFGTKEGVDFNAVYADLVKPALESEGFEVFRADEELRAGSIPADLFQELLLADLVVADLSINNPNVWYELGVRHALRKRGVIPIQCRRDYLPFDVYTDRTLHYSITPAAPDRPSVPDPHKVEQDRQQLREFARQTIESWYGRTISPVYLNLRDLREPDWRTLRSDQAREFWARYQEWADRIEVARRGGRPGDILVLASEAPARVFHADALKAAGKALRSLGQHAFALSQYEAALALMPDDLDSLQQKGILLSRLGKNDEAQRCLTAVLNDHPDDSETHALLGRVAKDAWVAPWRRPGTSVDDMRRDAAYEDARLVESIRAYSKAFALNPAHYYSGINAVTLRHLLRALDGRDQEPTDLAAMEGGVRWSVHSALAANPRDYWARVTLADLELLSADVPSVERAYRDAVAVADRDWFSLDSSRQQLSLLKDLGFRLQAVEAGLRVLQRELERLEAPSVAWSPRFVFLFSGHMVDAPGRPEPRFPPDKEDVAAAAIDAKLTELGAGEVDLALCGGACGGDLLFAEACLRRGLPLEVRIPFEEPVFLTKSVRFADKRWQERYFEVKNKAKTKLLIMPDELGASPAGVDPYARNNLWQLYSALAWGPEKTRFVCLWNRKGGDGPGGTQHMYETVIKHAGQVYVLDATTLW
jgi:tetratricopeptide (TPR) repeat protein